MTIATAPGETWEYVTKEDRDLPEDKRTVYVLRSLTTQERKKVDNAMLSQGDDMQEGLNLRWGDLTVTALKLGLEDVRNLRDADGQEVPFRFETVGSVNGRRRRVKDEFLDRVPAAVQYEVASAITKGNQLTEDDAKN